MIMCSSTPVRPTNLFKSPDGFMSAAPSAGKPPLYPSVKSDKNEENMRQETQTALVTSSGGVLTPQGADCAIPAGQNGFTGLHEPGFVLNSKLPISDLNKRARRKEKEIENSVGKHKSASAGPISLNCAASSVALKRRPISLNRTTQAFSCTDVNVIN